MIRNPLTTLAMLAYGLVMLAYSAGFVAFLWILDTLCQFEVWAGMLKAGDRVR